MELWAELLEHDKNDTAIWTISICVTFKEAKITDFTLNKEKKPMNITF